MIILLNLIQNQKIFVKKSKIQTIQESVLKREWEDTKIPEVSEQKPKELAYRMNEMEVQKLGKRNLHRRFCCNQSHDQ